MEQLEDDEGSSHSVEILLEKPPEDISKNLYVFEPPKLDYKRLHQALTSYDGRDKAVSKEQASRLVKSVKRIFFESRTGSNNPLDLINDRVFDPNDIDNYDGVTVSTNPLDKIGGFANPDLFKRLERMHVYTERKKIRMVLEKLYCRN